jgi:Zn-dependent protease with chaperone function
MAVHGYITHAEHNRRMTRLMFAAYVLAFQVIGAFALTFFLVWFDADNTILTNPLGYMLRYGLPLALVVSLVFLSIYRGHAAAIAGALKVKLVDRAEEPRFVAIAEEQCTALGVRFPRFGVIEVREPNALTVGEGRDHGLIAVTRGLLDELDDDELAAVMAHEASHIRQGDTQVLAANHALMRTAVIMQTHNVLRFEDWRQLIIPIAIPPMMLLMLFSSLFTMLSLKLARYARRGLKLTRDHVADGEAVRVTHFPEALVTALQKVSGRGRFAGSETFEASLFDGQTDHEGAKRPTARDRAVAIGKLGADLFGTKRSRRDTRGARSAVAVQPAMAMKAERDPLLDKEPGLEHLLLLFTDRDRFRRLQSASIDSFEWREDGSRDIFGLKAAMRLPTLAMVVAVCVLWWPADNNVATFAHRMSPMMLADLARKMDLSNGGVICSGPTYPDGTCKKMAQRR